MNAMQQVAMRLDERRRLVERVVEVLRADERVAAAAMISSYAREETEITPSLGGTVLSSLTVRARRATTWRPASRR